MLFWMLTAESWFGSALDDQRSYNILHAKGKRQLRFQVVNQNGEAVVDDYLEQGQLLTVPQNFAFLKRAESQGSEWICFYTNDNAMNSPMAGRISALRGIPDTVIAAGFGLSQSEAWRVKFSNQDTFFFTPSRSERRAEA